MAENTPPPPKCYRCRKVAVVRVLFLSPTDQTRPTSVKVCCRSCADDVVARTVRSDLLRLVPITGALR